MFPTRLRRPLTSFIQRFPTTARTPCDFLHVEDLIADIRLGRLVIIVDDEDRENEGDLVCAAAKITPEAINFMATHGRGLICAPITQEAAERLGLPLMVRRNTESHGTNFTVAGRRRRRRHHRDQRVGPRRHRRGAGQSPLRTARPRPPRPHPPAPGEAGRSAPPRRPHRGRRRSRPPRRTRAAGVICEILNEDGTMARLPQLLEFAKKHGLKIGRSSPSSTTAAARRS